MANGLDPHYLAALMNFATAQTGYQVAHDPDEDYLWPEDTIIYEPKPKIRTFPILDTFASISVSQEKSESIAIALQFHRQEQAVHLTIAGNDAVRGDLAEHLMKIWGKLQVLSSEYAHQEGRIGECGANGANPNETVRSTTVEIFRAIHEFSFQKLVKRARKWWPDLLILVQQLYKRRGGQLQGIDLNLLHAATGFYEGLRLLGRLRNKEETPLTEIEWETIYKESALAYSKARLVLADGNGSGCENLANEFQDVHPGSPFQLRRALEKLTALTRHAQWLIAYAKSPHLRSSLRYQLSVSVVPNQTRTVILPTSQGDWDSILEALGVEYEHDHGESDSRLLFENFHETNHLCPVHCESKVIQHLEAKHGNQWDIVAPGSYIAVSKPTCAACKIWIEAFNRLGGRQFHIRGSDDGKWVWPWGMPTLKEDTLEESLVREFSKQYLESQRVASLKRERSRCQQLGYWSPMGVAIERMIDPELPLTGEVMLKLLSQL
ncbi:unnamed protein product [Tuber aestivum]|uniref:Uncharacterized protein n=1 Tax=Tuber aestivum TaxID=59557 RepID=A0A292PN46_9PEZI|nr:unnamed protein product [Tuber aestivum]